MNSWDPHSGPRSDHPTAAGARETVAWALGLGRNAEIVRQVEGKVRRTRRQRLVALSSVALIAIAAGGTFYFRRDRAPMRADFAPATAVVSLARQQVLPDGTRVELKEGARVTVAFAADGPGIRRVVLANGEAHFSVTKNPARPFIVVAGGIEARAVGTAFSVTLEQRGVAVLVTEGRVAVQRPATTGERNPPPAVTLDAGHRVVVDLTTTDAKFAAPVAVDAAQLATELAWRAPRIRFANTSLTEAVTVFNQHSTIHLVLDPALGDLRIGGVVRADNTDSFLYLLKTEFGIEAATMADGSIRLARR